MNPVLHLEHTSVDEHVSQLAVEHTIQLPLVDALNP